MDFIEDVNLLSDRMQNPQNTSTGSPIKQPSLQDIWPYVKQMGREILTHWIHYISFSISIVLKPALCAQTAFKGMFKRQELSALEWANSIIIATDNAL